MEEQVLIMSKQLTGADSNRFLADTMYQAAVAVSTKVLGIYL